MEFLPIARVISVSDTWSWENLMKRLFVLALVLPLLEPQANVKKDVFFPSDHQHFIRTTTLPPGLMVRLEACQLLDKTTREAVCQQLADIPKSEFQSMRDCLDGLFAHELEFLGGGTIAVLGALSGELFVGLGMIVGGGMMMDDANDTRIEINKRKMAFDKKVESGSNLVADSTFEDFVGLTKKAIQRSFKGCQISGAKVSDAQQKVVISPEQARFLEKLSSPASAVK